MSNFTCQSKSFISIFFICQVSACELRLFSCYNLANDIYSQTAKTVFSHLNQYRGKIKATIKQSSHDNVIEVFQSAQRLVSIGDMRLKETQSAM